MRKRRTVPRRRPDALSPYGHEWEVDAFGIVVQRHRLEHRWPPEELAARSGVARMTVVHVEQHKFDPKMDTQRRLARGLRMRFSRLMLETEAEAKRLRAAHRRALRRRVPTH